MVRFGLIRYENGYILCLMNRQPLLIYKTRNGIPVPPVRHFSSTAKAKKWLRNEGCKFSNKDFYNLGTDVVELVTDEFEYEIEIDIEPVRRRRGG